MEIADGKYRGKARGSGTLIESGKGTPGIAVEFDFTTEQGLRTLTWTGWLSEAAYERTVESLRLLGWEGDDISNVTGIDKNEVELVVENEEYEGNYYPRIKFINRIGSVLGAPMTAEKAKSFAAAFRDRLRAAELAKGGGKPAPAQQRKASSAPTSRSGAQPPEPPPHTDADNFDVPF